MEASGAEQGRTQWLHWLMWWKIDAVELRRQVEGYETLSMIASARGRGLLLAILSGIVMTAVAGWVAMDVGVIEFDRVALAEGVVFAALGGLLYLGNGWAGLGLMALCTFDRLFEAVAAGGVFYPLQGRHDGLSVLMSLVAWAMFMHAFYVAFCVERQRSETAATALVADGLAAASD
jgi:hypothetical protein